jgi:hypothetical protein
MMKILRRRYEEQEAIAERAERQLRYANAAIKDLRELVTKRDGCDCELIGFTSCTHKDYAHLGKTKAEIQEVEISILEQLASSYEEGQVKSHYLTIVELLKGEV